MPDYIDKMQKQGQELGYLLLVVDEATYEKPLPREWFYKIAIANIEVDVANDYLPESKDQIGCVIYEENSVYWLKIWD